MSERYEKGLKQLNELDPNAAEGLIESFRDICPDLAKYTIEYPFGDVLQREGLDFKTRELATIAALTALGNCQPQLKGHISGALNLGCTPKAITEVILQMSVYAGFPAAINGMTAAKEVFESRGIITAK
ncbi:carboxymuconolactone decarboxylase family protein [Photobacterium alginatilyticum]|uniref:Carboxymuconolactone decarboxylase family protein n=1 Tax=Photobacterium alginatilyticum TaxID=1775171 RepID=A0ABW9YKC8_9GAMM|nr:carboxymuconolactone decarboxylase family protein [Photobacterium alginatilyticum]NBI54238.1 carboxymuconolactone decarboxylase family protein [Photobacterium alginatilyticum]